MLGEAAKGRQAGRKTRRGLGQDPPCTLKLGYMVPNSGYLGPRG